MHEPLCDLILEPSVINRSYAATRWATAIMTAVRATDDPRTFAHWERLAGASRSSLSMWCRTASASPRNSLTLARLVRGLRLTHGWHQQLVHVLDIADPRTLDRLFTRAGIPPTVLRLEASSFLLEQRLVTSPVAIRKLSAFLSDAA
jgi:hypothetical protein